MSENEAPDSPVAEVPGPGAVLRQVREARGVTVAEVAASLKMSPRQIEAIEREDFSRLSGATFIKGSFRNYAKLLKIDATPLLAALAEKAELAQTELTGLAGSGVRMPNGTDGSGKGSLAATFVALALLAGALALYFDVIDVGALLRLQAEAPPAAAPRPVAEPRVVRPLAGTAATPQVEAAAAQPVATAQGPSPKAGARQLVFSFDGDAWVEVKDAAGRTVFSRMNPKGTTEVVEGSPPLQLVVGNASSVRLQYNDQPVDLKPHTRVEVARLTLE